VQSANTPVTGSDLFDGQRWTTGLSWMPEACGIGGTHWICPPAGGSAAAAKTVDPALVLGASTYKPVTIWTGDSCSPVGKGAEEIRARAERQLAACESKYIERELWLGTAAIARNEPNAYLAMNGTVDVVGQNMGIVLALAELEQALTECSCGGVGMIHAQARTVTHWVREQLVHREGNTFVTELGTIVVVGSGYNGQSPTGTAATETKSWAYATGMVTVLRGETKVIPSNVSEALDRSTNTITYRAEREVAAVFDPCCHLGVSVDLNTAGVTNS
jgi:hypothetical protein